MLELLGALDPWILLRFLIPALQIVGSAPPCPGEPQGFPEDVIYYSYSWVREMVWGQPCPPP